MRTNKARNNEILSVLCPSFNHEKYVGFFIESLIKQTNPNWELIIVDDFSTDNNVNEIKKYHDKRIHLIEHKYNKGINCALNTAYKKSSGAFIAFCASDDMLEPDYVETVLNVFRKETKIGVIYNDLIPIDVNNNIVVEREILKNKRGTRYELLKKLFEEENCVNSPGMAVRREIFDKIMPLPIPLSIYQDYKINIDLLLRTDVIMLEKPHVRYRLPSEKSGISFNNYGTKIRLILDEKLLMDTFLQVNNVQMIKDIFAEDLGKYQNFTKQQIPFVLGMLAMNKCKLWSKQIWGYNQIVSYMQEQSNYDFLNKEYGFCYKQFLNLANLLKQPIYEIKYTKYKKLFNLLIIVFGTYVLISLLLLFV